MEDRPRSDRVKPTTPHADWQRNGPRKSEVETDLFVGVELDWGCGLDWPIGVRRSEVARKALRAAILLLHRTTSATEGPKGSERKREKKRRKKRQSEGEKNKNENKRERILVTALITRLALAFANNRSLLFCSTF